MQEEVCNAADAASRLDAALHSVQRGGHTAGVTKCSTASNSRPTVLDYHFAFTHGRAGWCLWSAAHAGGVQLFLAVLTQGVWMGGWACAANDGSS